MRATTVAYRLITGRKSNHSCLTNHRFILFVALLGLFCLSVHSDALASNPGDMYVFPSESPVAPTGNNQYNATIVGNIALWSDNEGPRQRIFFKDLSKAQNEPGHALIDGDLHGKRPAINQNADRVVWQETDAGSQVYYQNVNFSNDFSGCVGTLQQCGAIPIFPEQSWQENPAISPDGSKVTWESGRSSDSKIFLHDFDTGTNQEVYSMPGGDQEYPSVDNDWVVWTDSRNYNVFAFPLNSAIYVKQISSSAPARPIATNNGNPDTSGYPYSVGNANVKVWGAKVSRNLNNEPVVIYLSSSKDRYGVFTYSVHLYNLANNSDQTVYEKKGILSSPSIDGDKVVLIDCSDNSNCDVVLLNLSSGISQTVTQDQSLGAGSPSVSRGSGYIVWNTTHTSPADIYYNRIGDTAQVLANKYRPELRMTLGENFQPMPVEQFLSTPGTQLKSKDDTNFTPKDNPTSAMLASYADKTGLYLDLPGDSVAAGGGNPSHSIDHDRVTTDYVTPYRTGRDKPGDPYPRTIYARVVSRPAGDEKSFIQYWLFYYSDDHAEIFHEGDWEVVQVELNKDLKPFRADYSQHGYGQWRNWDGPGSVKKSETSPDQPIVYVGLGSHANYFSANAQQAIYYHGINLTDTLGVWDDASGNGHILNNPQANPPMITQVKVIPETDQVAGGEFEWIKYPGQWGEFTNADVGVDSCWICIPPHGDIRYSGLRDGSDNPPVQPYWTNAFAWSDNNCDGCEDSQAQGTNTQTTVESPADINLYDSQGRHTGKNPDGSIDQEIPNSEYLEYSDLHRKSIIIHGSDILPGYRFEATGNGTGPANFIITAPDHPGGTVDTLIYNSVQVNPSTKITMTLDAAKNYTMGIDDDGDGANVVPKSPDTVTTNTYDFTPPAQVSDLAVTGTGSGSVTVSFTAPGDDANTGTATSYDLRYSDSAITDQYWGDAVPAGNLPAPLTAGSTQTITVDGLNPGSTYYFALRAMDETGLFSPTSNIVSVYIPITRSTAGTASAVPSNIDAISVDAPYSGDENSDGSALIEYKLSSDAAWSVYGTVSHPATSATISGLATGGSYDVKVTFQDPDGVDGTAEQIISTVQLPAPPSASNVQPSGTIYGPTATISADLSAGFGINTSAVFMTLDGNTVQGCAVTAIHISCPASGPSFGPHQIGGSVEDSLGNVAAISGSFNVGDSNPPSVTSVLPMGTVYGGATTITVNFSDPGITSGIDANSVTVSLDGNPLSSCTATTDSASCPASGVLAGDHIISGSVSDNSGNATVISGGFKMIEWSEATAIYQSGLIPSQPSLYQLSDGRTMLAYTEQFTNSIKFRVSSDGVNWQIPTGSSGTIPYAAGVQPNITQLPSGVVVVTYAEYWYNGMSGTYSWVVRVATSSDLIHWSWPDFAGAGDCLAPSAATLANGQVMLTYTKLWNGSADIRGQRGTFNGTYWTWSSQTVVYNGALYDSKPSVVDLGNNELICAFFSGASSGQSRNDWVNRDIFAVRSTDGGLTWQNQNPITVYAGSGSADFWPTLLRLSSGQLICAFTTSDEGSVNQLNIKMVRSNDNGISWGSEEMISTAVHSESWPALAQRPDGTVICVWDSDPGQTSNVYYLYSSRLVIP